MIDKLYQVICARRDRPQAASYVASLMKKGPDAILKKVGEEAAEVIIAAKNQKISTSPETETGPEPADQAAALVHEIADLTFHLLVLMAEKKIPPAAISAELERRFGTSGLTEKAGRK